ncbi:MAG: efflux RND transporter periplasmic adaptor subunit [Nitratireductor sp.]|nr:efflux RND transporter periplasmic adaptor subunit [Nitratireductor sp.]
MKSEPSGVLRAIFRKPIVRNALIAAGLLASFAAGIAISTNRPLRVETASHERNVAVRVFGLGTVEARIRSDIGFEVGATLDELHVDHGDHVKKGQLLAHLNAGEQEAKVAKARAALQVGHVNVERSQASLRKANTVFAQKQQTNRRQQKLAERNVVSEQIAEDAALEEAVARADVALARSEVASAEAQLADARAQLQFEETMLRHRTLRAPYDALAIARHKELGTVVKAGEPIFTLIGVGSYWGLAYVDEARAGFLHEGQHVDARLRSRPQDAFTGEVVRIDLESDRVTEERRVYIKGNNPPPRVYLGEQVEFWITVASLDNALLVPEAAVKGYDGRRGSVWTVDNGHLLRQTVRFRHRTEDARLEIVAGLKEGTRVVTQLENGFRDGRAVRAIEGDE